MAISDNVRAAVYMTTSMAAFTINDMMMQAAMRDYPLFNAILVRGVMATAGLILLGVLIGGLSFNITPRDRRVIGWRSVGEVASTLLFLTALTHLDITVLNAIMQALPLAVTLAAAVFLGEKLGVHRLGAIVLGFVGVLIIIRPGTDAFQIWSLVGLSSVAFIVLRDLATRNLSRDVPSVTVAIAASCSVTATAAIVTLFQGLALPTGWQLLLMAGAAGFILVGYMSAVMVMRVGEIGFAAPFRYTGLLWAIGFSFLVYRTIPDAYMLVGAVLVVVSGLYMIWHERRH